MTTEKLRGWLEIIGIFGVIASLIFVGIQIQQDQEIARANMYQARSDMLSQTMASAAGNPDFIAVLAKTSFGDTGRAVEIEGLRGTLTAEEFLVFFYQQESIFALTDNSFYQVEQGFLPPSHWSDVRAKIKDVASSNAAFRHLLKQKLATLRPTLRDELILILDETDVAE
jgi:hypothetical protein